MKETDRHKAAFEYYCGLEGVSRKLSPVGRKMGVSRTTVGRWSVEFKWLARAADRDEQRAQAIAKANDKNIVKDAVTHTKKVNDALRLIQAALATAIPSLQNGTFKVDRAADLAAMCRALSDLIRLDQLLAGEADSHQKHTLKVIHVFQEGYAGPKPVESEVVDG